ASGQVTPLDTPLVVTVSLGGVAVNTTATIYFDLLGFGATGSTVRVDNVQLVGLEGDQLPTANNDTASVAENGTLTVNAPGILANDTDLDVADTKTVVAVNAQPAAIGKQITLGSGAHLTVQADGRYTYDPNGKFESLRVGQTASDSFVYTMSD